MAIKKNLKAAFIGFAASGAVVVVGTLLLFVIASLISEDQRAYNNCLVKHKSVDYCLLVVHGR
jgi:hypothetical protein